MGNNFLDQFLKIQRDISLAMNTGGDSKDHLINNSVHRLKTLYYSTAARQHDHHGVTTYQLALICLEIIWWGDPDLHDNLEAFAQEVFDLCAEMREDAAAAAASPTTAEARGPKKTKGKGNGKDKGGYCDAVLEVVLEHLEALTQEALAYLREQTERIRRRPQARKWLDYIRVEALRPHVPPMSGRVEDEPKQMARRGVKFVVFRDDQGDEDEDEDEDKDEEDDNGGGGAVGDEDANDSDGDKMQTDNDGIEEGAEEVHHEEHQTPPAPLLPTTTKRNRRIIKSNKRARHYYSSHSGPNHPQTSDPRCVIYKRALARYWAQDPAAWCAVVDRWEEEHGAPGCSRGLVEELVAGMED